MSEREDDDARLARLSAVADAPSAADALERVLEAALDCAPRAAIFLVRAGHLRGWRCGGYDDGASRRFERTDLDASRTWVAPLLAGSSTSPLLPRDAGGDGPDFGQPAADQAVAVALRAGPVVLGIVLAERFHGQQPWSVAGLGSLGLLTSQRLALELARRRPAVAPTALSSPAENEPIVWSTEEPALSEPAVAPPIAAPPAQESGLVPLEESDAPRPATGRRGEAIRFARLVASDIRLYNEDAVLSGRAHRDLAARLERELVRGRATFLRRFSDLGDEGLAVLEQAYVELLAGGDATLLRPVST